MEKVDNMQEKKSDVSWARSHGYYTDNKGIL